VCHLKVSYNKLFKLLIDRQMKKGELCRAANINLSTMGKLAKGENVNVDMLVKICGALDCTMDDIIELIPDEASE
jgi:DNA-binding Xre family transcriptional regulator